MSRIGDLIKVIFIFVIVYRFEYLVGSHFVALVSILIASVVIYFT